MRGTRAAVAAALAVLAAPVAANAADTAPAPIDPQNWSWQDELTWNDYKKLPGPDYSDPSIQPTVKKWKVALVVTDFPGTPYTITRPQGGTVFGTPTAEAHDIPRANVATFLRDFYNTPQPLNHFQTMNRYWMEDSFGRYGVQLDAFGPYELPGRQYQYFLNDQGSNNTRCPTAATTPCNKNFRTDARAAWQADVGAAKIAEYDNVFYTSAGEDESSTWQEFGEMKWMTPEEVTDPFGPDQFDSTLPTNWAATRYVPWTSWVSAATNWPNASGNTSVEAESSGMSTYAHELSHNLNIPDNYGNPYATIQQRGFTGMWDMMSRGTFNGPGGPHTRFLIPPTQGSSLGSQHNLRNKRFLNFVSDGDLVRLNRNGLASSGLAVADVTAREVPHSTGEVAGVRIELDGAVGDNATPCNYQTDWRCDGVRTQGTTVTGKYNAYTMEVVQQIGSDSFDPGHGVLITKVKNSSSSCGGSSCFAWIIDSHPDDINHVDFVRPDGTPKIATLGDERQLNDASFNAGLDSGSSYEWTDERNRLHFYVVDKTTDAQGILHYKVAVKSLDGAGPQSRGVALQSGVSTEVAPGQWSTCTFTLKNTGAAAATDPALHPQDQSANLTSDVYRLSATATGTGWSAKILNALTAVKFGESVKVPVYVTKGTGASANGTASLTATSESDPSKTQTAVCGLGSGDVGGSVPATLALTLGTPASFGAFTPGVGKLYAASTTANVISSAGDATLTVADPSATNIGKLVNGTFALNQPLMAQASSPAAGPAGAFAAVGGSAAPTQLAKWTNPVANDPVTIGFQQTILASEPLRTGAYGKTLTFTLSTTTP
ncbi:immune inhibitor A domain-containing protein [Solirubrobacter soli]|uniref:immune inhibitor A domain-containing protein n=1 Tax=Solirubrobacter soli TaxID=363832 RepID=UPI00041D8EC7|nr:immune inhibitor A domain-containing protein [Solirubrobacter soli]